jgi:hypothetical protein
MKKKREVKIAISFRLSRTAIDLLKRLATRTGLGRQGVVELALRTLAREQGVK